MMTYQHLVELKLIDDETPALALSGLNGRILAVEVASDAGLEQIGQASRFQLKTVTWPHDAENNPVKRMALCCWAEMDQKKFDALKPSFLDGGIQLFVGNHQILWCDSPAS